MSTPRYPIQATLVVPEERRRAGALLSHGMTIQVDGPDPNDPNRFKVQIAGSTLSLGRENIGGLPDLIEP